MAKTKKTAPTNTPEDKENEPPTKVPRKPWSEDLEFDPTWSFGKKRWYNQQLKKHNPARWKEWQKANLEKRLQNLQE